MVRTLHLHGQPGEPARSAEAFRDAIAVLEGCPLRNVGEVVRWERAEALEEDAMEELRVVGRKRALKVKFLITDDTGAGRVAAEGGGERNGTAGG